MQLDLNQEESLLLERVLMNQFGDLRMQISDADNSRFKEGLRHEKDVVQHILDKLETAARELAGAAGR